MDCVIRKLPQNVQHTLQASSHINSLVKAVEELLYNSLDSNSSSIAVRVNCNDLSLQIIDNGHGINPRDMDIVGTRYATSKAISERTSDHYGYKGMALSNLIDVSENLKITSRSLGSDSTLVKEFRRGNCETIRETIARPSNGTTVEIKGLLYNLAIPRKNLNAKAELQMIKNLIEKTAVCHPGVSFSLRDDTINNVIVKIPKNKDVNQTVQSIYGIDIDHNCKELQIEKNKYKIKAHIGNKLIEDDFQLIYLNKICLVNSKLHKLFNNDLTKIFAVGNEGRNKQKMTMKDTESNSKIFPFYILFISCPYADYDLSQVSNKTLVEFHNWTAIAAILRRLIKVFEESLLSTNKIGDKKNENIENISTIKAKNSLSKDLIQEKVANIVNKVLKSDPKKLQGHNEVKGKPAKRKRKKLDIKSFKLDKNLLSVKSMVRMNKLEVVSVKPKRQCKQPVKEDVVSHSYLVESELQSKKEQNSDKVFTESDIKDIQFKKSGNTNESYSDHKNPNNKHVQQIKNKQMCLPQKAVSKVFDAVDGSVKQRCKNISTNVSKLMKKYNFKHKNAKCFKVEQVTTSKSVYKNKTHSIQKTSGKIVIKQFVPFPKNCDKREFVKQYFNTMLKDGRQNKLEVKSRYDLLQTIIRENNQIEYKEDNMKIIKDKDNGHENANLQIVSKSVSNENQEAADKFIPPQATCDYLNYLTYQSHKSHKYNEKAADMLTTKKNLEYGTKTNAISRYIQTDRTAKNSIKFKKPATIPLTKQNKGKYLKPDIKSQAVDFSDTADFDTEYNFDNEVNKPIELTLTPTEIPEIHPGVEGFSKNFENCNEILPNCNNNNNETYTVEKKIINIKENLIPHSNDNSNISVDHVSNTFDEMNIKTQDKVIYETIHEVSDENVIVESNEVCSEFNLLKNNEFKRNGLTLRDIQVTFASKPYPEEENIQHQIPESGPIEICEVIMESSDLFNSESLYFNTSVSQQINDLEMHALKTNNSDVNYEIIGKTECNISGNQTDVDISYRQINQSQYNFNRELKYAQLTKNSQTHDDLKVNNVKNFVVNEEKNYRDCCNVNINSKECCLDLKTGMTRAANNSVGENSYSVKKRPNYVPKGLSPIFQHQNSYNKDTVVLPSQEYFTKSMYENFTEQVDKGTRVYEATVKNLADNGDGTRYKKLGAAIVFDNAALAKAQVIRQIDDKFIACLAEGRSYRAEGMAEYLVLFDQHAVDERIRLEQLLQDYRTDSVWNSEPYNLKLSISEEERFYMDTYAEKFSELGFQWSVENCEGKIVLNVGSIPRAIVGKHIRKVDAIVSAVKTVIREHVKTVKCMKAAANAPKSMLDLVNMEACRFAVKFGDKLNREQCAELVRAVARCAVPFQCAHGRPDMAVLLMISSEQRKYQIDIEKLKKFKLKF